MKQMPSVAKWEKGMGHDSLMGKHPSLKGAFLVQIRVALQRLRRSRLKSERFFISTPKAETSTVLKIHRSPGLHRDVQSIPTMRGISQGGGCYLEALLYNFN